MSQNIDPASDKTEFHDLDQFPNRNITVGDYTKTLGCVHDLMPYGHLAHDPWDELAELQTWLREQPDTMATFQLRDLPKDSDISWTKINRAKTHIHVLGGWQSHYVNQRPRYVNPYYRHIDAIDWTPLDKKWDHYQELAGYGKFSVGDLATRYGVVKQTVSKLCQRRGYSYDELRREGRRRMGNTVKCTVAWTDLTIQECARRADIHPPTMWKWVNNWADVDVPPKPSSHDRANTWGWPDSQ